MHLRTIYALFCAVVGAMAGAVLAAMIIFISAIIALISVTGLPPAVELLFWALIIAAFIGPIIAGAWVGVRWGRTIEASKGSDLAVERQKAYIFLGFACIVAMLLLLFALLRLA